MAASGRLVDGCTGCSEHGAGDVVDKHHYSPPASPAFNASTMQYAANGEFGGLGFEVQGHAWIPGGCHGYAVVHSAEALTSEFEKYSESIISMMHSSGLSASVYTQTSDCERECNGVMTYDRIPKPIVDRWKAANQKIIAAANEF